MRDVARAFPAWRMIRDARLSAGLTQRQLAARSGTSQAAVTRYETAKALPDLETLARLLLACGRRLELMAAPLDEQEQRQVAESAHDTPSARVERNRRITSLASRSAAARRDDRVRALGGHADAG